MIISYNIGGLANRMKAISSGYRLSEYKNRDMKIKWDILDNYEKHTHILNCPFNRLFKNDNIIHDGTNINNIKCEIYTSHCLAILESDNIPYNFNNFNSNCNKQFTKSDKHNRNIDFMYNKIPKEIKMEYIEYFKKLRPIETIQNNIDIFSKKFTTNTISLHIRSWNRNGEGGRRSGLYNLNKYLDVMDMYDETYIFYLSTDSQEVKDILLMNEKYKDRILVYPRKTNLDKSRDYPDGVIDDLTELYLLSKNKIIIGSHFSTFTEVAWYLAECPDDIIIV